MTPLFKALLIVGAVLALAYVLRKIRKAEMQIADSTFWFLFALSIVVLAVFPQIAFFCAEVLSIESPANFVFLYIMAVLVIRVFISTAEISQLRSKVASLTQEMALRDAGAVRDADALAGKDADAGDEADV